MNLHLIGMEIMIPLSYTLFLLSPVNAGIHRKRSDVSDWTRAWKTASDGMT